jgi:tetratricopeptide (TPR) repeat protein
MPATINGIGTQYYGKKNLRVYEGVCESCQRPATLTDYETGYYVVVLYVPVIPLGRKQIIGDCSICRQHHVMPLRQWEQMREESLESGLSELAENVGDPATALDLLQRMTVFNQLDEARDLAAATAKQHHEDFETQIHLGAWYEQQGDSQSSQRCFRRAIELNADHPASKRIQAVEAFEQGRPREAAKHLEALRGSAEHDDPALFFRLGTALQEKQMHAEALAEFEDLLRRHPGAGQAKHFRKAVRKSEKALGKSNSILPKKRLFG